jgi:hypothetical protein
MNVDFRSAPIRFRLELLHLKRPERGESRRPSQPVVSREAVVFRRVGLVITTGGGKHHATTKGAEPRKARYLVAFGAWPALGGILGLANLTEKQGMLKGVLKS